MTNGTQQLAPDRMAPHSIEAEEALLGGILLNPDAYAELDGRITPPMFFIVRNGYVFEAIERLVAREDEVDTLTVVEELRQQNRLEEVGGAAYITYLINHTPSSIYTDTYAGIVERAAIRRGYLNAAQEIARWAWCESEAIEDVIDGCESAVIKVGDNRHKAGLVSAQTIMSKVYQRVEQARLTGISGQSTGLTGLDQLLGGLQNTDLIIVAGRPGSGKTSLGLTICKNRCEKGGRPLILSKEMDDEQLGMRMVSMETGIGMHQMRTGQVSDTEWSGFVTAHDKIGGFKFMVDDSSNMPLSQLKGMARRAKKDFGIDLVIVDYLQLIKASGDTRHQQVASVARELKDLARELKLPVLCMAQLNRNVEQRQDKRPVLADLAESGEIEQAADVVIFIYRDDMYNENTERPNQADLIVAKHRNGPTGTVATYFRKELTQFSNLAKAEFDLAAYNDDDYRNRRQDTD